MPEPLSNTCKKVIVICAVGSMGLVSLCQTIAFFSPAWHCKIRDHNGFDNNAFDKSGPYNMFDNSGSYNAYDNSGSYYANDNSGFRNSLDKTASRSAFDKIGSHYAFGHSRLNSASPGCKYHGLFYPDGIVSGSVFSLCLVSWLGTLSLMLAVGLMVYKARSDNNGDDIENSQDGENDPLAELFDDCKFRLLLGGFVVTQLLAGVAFYLGYIDFLNFGWSAILFAWFGMLELLIIVLFFCYKIYQIYQRYGGGEDEEE